MWLNVSDTWIIVSNGILYTEAKAALLAWGDKVSHQVVSSNSVKKKKGFKSSYMKSLPRMVQGVLESLLGNGYSSVHIFPCWAPIYASLSGTRY